MFSMVPGQPPKRVEEAFVLEELLKSPTPFRKFYESERPKISRSVEWFVDTYGTELHYACGGGQWR